MARDLWGLQDTDPVPLPTIDFRSIREHLGAKSSGFEELVYQLIPWIDQEVAEHEIVRHGIPSWPLQLAPEGRARLPCDCRDHLRAAELLRTKDVDATRAFLAGLENDYAGFFLRSGLLEALAVAWSASDDAGASDLSPYDVRC